MPTKPQFLHKDLLVSLAVPTECQFSGQIIGSGPHARVSALAIASRIWPHGSLLGAPSCTYPEIVTGMFHFVGFVGNAYQTAFFISREFSVSLAMPTTCQISGLITCVAGSNHELVLYRLITTRMVAAASFPFQIQWKGFVGFR